MVNSEKKAPYSWNQKSTLYSCDYLSGQFPDIDTRAIEKMVLENHAKKRVMHEDPNNIRGEDIRIDYDENIKKLKNKLCCTDMWTSGIVFKVLMAMKLGCISLFMNDCPIRFISVLVNFRVSIT